VINEGEINVADFIAENFAMESAVWFWAENTEKAIIYQGENETYVSINTYICTVEASNKNNLFLVTQLMVNGTQRWGYPSLQEMATQKNDIETDSDNIYFKSGSQTPNGWLKRRNDWDNAVKLTGEQFN